MVPLASAANRALGGRDRGGEERRGRQLPASARHVKCLLNPEHRCAWSWQRESCTLLLHFGLTGRKCGGGEKAGDGQGKGLNIFITYAKI